MESKDSKKYIFVTGGVLSGLGKGVTASSIGLLLKSRGIKVTMIKIDPYLNCDAGTMNPYQHGEVFVLDDGGEIDLDFGNYERFLDINLTSEHNITTGTIYRQVIEKERRGDYLGQTVQIIPHVTDEIKLNIRKVVEKSKARVAIIELGGTVGDIESMPFLEAARQLHREIGDKTCVFVHATLVPVLSPVGEQKTKPTQHSVKELRALGIKPDVIVGRSEEVLEENIVEKISLFCDVPQDAVISAPNLDSIYEVPVTFEEQNLTELLMKRLDLRPEKMDLTEWRNFLKNAKSKENKVTIAIVGKYTDLPDSYISYEETFSHASAKLRTEVDIEWIEAEDFTEEAVKEVGGILVPGGFGRRGSRGKIEAIKYARTSRKPFLGICFGFQLAVVEFARNVLGCKGANSTEFEADPTHPVIDLLPEQKEIEEKGATMRLGASLIQIDEDSLAYKLYKKGVIWERHRHRYEVNPDYVADIEDHGFKFSGKSPDGRRMEIGELTSHPFFIACQFHPEFTSRPTNPHPLFVGFVKACLQQRKKD